MINTNGIDPDALRVATRSATISPEAVLRALGVVRDRLPHLRDLSYAVRVVPSLALGTVSIDPDGFLFYDPHWLAELDEDQRVFVLAHELEHLRLKTFERATWARASRAEFNVAHDFVINDRLRTWLGIPVPGDGLIMVGAAQSCAEDILEMYRDPVREEAERALRPSVHHVRSVSDRRTSLVTGVLDPPTSSAALDGSNIIDPAHGGAARTGAYVRLALDDVGDDEGVREIVARYTTRFGGIPRYRLDWELKLPEFQEDVPWASFDDSTHWREPTYARASRRRECTDDHVVPGRRSRSACWTLILDVSCSVARMPRALAALRHAARGRGVERLRIVQCDGAVVADDEVAVEELESLEIRGRFGTEVLALLDDCTSCGRRHGFRLTWMRTDLGAAFRRLERTGAHNHVFVLTDGYVEIPVNPPTFDVTFVVESENTTFRPAYGTRVDLGADSVSRPSVG